MFWNKDKIPDYINSEEDLFRFDDDVKINEHEANNKYNTHVSFNTEEKKEKKVKVKKEKKNRLKKEKEIKNIKIDNENLINTLLNIVLVIVIIVAFIILFDVIRTSRYDKTPIFANHTVSNKKYDLYEGIGYKVYYYHINGGKNTIEIGGSSLKYDDKAIKTNTLDLSLLFNNDFDKFTNEYLNKYISITGNVYKVNDNVIYLEYEDESGKYTTIYKCSLLNHKDVKEKDTVTINGMLDDYDKESKIIYIDRASIK